jgi:DNA-directed RNA polymerase specialized sigma subunit
MDPTDFFTMPDAKPPSSWKLEPEFHDAFRNFKARPGTGANTEILKALRPTLATGLKSFGGPAANPMLRSRAKRLALDAVRTYDPEQAQLKTHVMNHLQGLNRYAARQGQLLSVPERVAIDRGHLEAAEAELRDTLGREPSSAEVADHTGLSVKRQAYVRGYRPGFAEGQLEAGAGGGDGEGGGWVGPAVAQADPTAARLEFLYHDLDPTNQAIVEHAYGLHGRRQLRPGQIAQKLNLSPGAISQRSARIQRMLDELDDLGLFR